MKFRNLDVDDDAPVGEWPQEALLSALERGSLQDWRRIAREIKADPWGPVARSVGEILTYSRPYGVSDAMEVVIANARADAERSERDAVAAELRTLVASSGLSNGAFASRLGTSGSRLSTYLSG